MSGKRPSGDVAFPDCFCEGRCARGDVGLPPKPARGTGAPRALWAEKPGGASGCRNRATLGCRSNPPKGTGAGRPVGRRSPAERRESQGAPLVARLCEFPGIVPRTPFTLRAGGRRITIGTGFAVTTPSPGRSPWALFAPAGCRP